jgi:hypothetical protein
MSSISCGATTWLQPGLPPAAITDLIVRTGGNNGTVELTWTAPGDDNYTGVINNGYWEIKYSTASYDVSAAGNAQVVISTSNVIPMTTRCYTITGLNNGATYYFRIWTVDDCLVRSEMSNCTTAWAFIDRNSPGKISGFKVYQSTQVNMISLQWVTPGDDVYAGVLPVGSEYRIQYTTFCYDGFNWSTASAQVVFSTAGVIPGKLVGVNVGLPAVTVYWITVRVKDELDNWSVVSDSITIYPNQFNIQVVDVVGGSPVGRSIKVDNQGNPHIAYHDSTNGDLKYAKWTGSGWDIQTVDSAGNVGGYPSLQFDNLGNPYISYLDMTNNYLKYARWTGSVWELHTIDSANVNEEYSGLGIDALNVPHIVYNCYSNTDVKFAEWTGTRWSTQTIESVIGYTRYASLGFDGSERAHVIYYDDGSHILKYAVQTSTGWYIENVDYATDLYGAIAVDGTGNPHISYYNWTSQDLKYAYRTNGGWVNQTVDTVGMVGKHTSIVVDGDGNPHISYTHTTEGGFKYAGKINGEWLSYPVESVLTYDDKTSICLDKFGNVHVTYCNGNPKYTKYAKWSNTGFKPIVCPPTEFRAAAVYVTSVTWAWVGVDNVSGYRIYGGSSSPFTLVVDTPSLPAGNCTWTETGITSNIEITRYVQAMNAGSIANSSPCVVCTYAVMPDNVDYSVPDRVTDLFVTPGWHDLVLNWTMPGDDGYVGNITSGCYEIRCSTSGSLADETSWQDVTGQYPYKIVVTTSAVPGQRFTQLITGLINNVTYYFGVKVRDENSNNWSGVNINTGTSFGMPFNHSPSSFSLVSPLTGTVVVSTPVLVWTQSVDPDTDDSVVYKVFVSSVQDFSVMSVYPGISVSSMNVATQLVENAAYWWKVSAQDTDGIQVWSDTKSFVVNFMNEPPTSFGLVYPMFGQNVNSVSINLVWDSSIDPDINDTVSYKLYYSYDSWLSSTVVSVNTTGYLVNGLLESKTYHWYVEARDAGSGKTLSRETSWYFCTPDLTAPARIEEIRLMDLPSDDGGSIIAGWDYYSVPADIMGYNVYYGYTKFVSTSQSCGNKYFSAGEVVTGLVLTGLISNVTDYYVSIVPVDVSGNGDYVNMKTFGPIRPVKNRVDSLMSAVEIMSPYEPLTKVVVDRGTNNGLVIDIDNVSSADKIKAGIADDNINKDKVVVTESINGMKNCLVEFKCTPSLKSDVTIHLSYGKYTVADYINENMIRVFVLDPDRNRWLLVSGQQSVNKTDKTVCVRVTHFSVYRLLTVKQAVAGLKNVYVYPNPWKYDGSGNEEIVFKQLTKVAVIKIFNITGELVFSVNKDNELDECRWDLKNIAGEKVTSGIYLYTVNDDTGGIIKGKFAVVR